MPSGPGNVSSMKCAIFFESEMTTLVLSAKSTLINGILYPGVPSPLVNVEGAPTAFAVDSMSGNLTHAFSYAMFL